MVETPDKTRLYPTLVPAGYFGDKSISAVHRPLIEGIDVALAFASEELAPPGTDFAAGLLSYARPRELRVLGLSLDEAFRLALDHLEQAAEKGHVQARMVSGADGKGKAVIWSGHWLSATCILLRGLPKIASAALGTSKIIALIPDRNSLVLFADSPDRKKWVTWVLENEAQGRKPLTRRPLKLTTETPKEFWVQAPIAYAD
jgi:hypothetical protein